MIILGIETSCDETSAALLKVSDNNFKLLSHTTFTQIKTHKKYGGVVPEVAARLHVQKIIPVLETTLKNLEYYSHESGNLLITASTDPASDLAGMTFKDLDYIAVTAGPGLVTSLITGIHTARCLSYIWQKPLIAVNHIEAHVAANLLSTKYSDIKFPALCLVVSGGHTELILIKKWGEYKIIGSTRDDAAGESFDKVAKILGLGYPGGPEVSKLAQAGKKSIEFPRPMMHEKSFDFSFSGLKTAVLYKVRELESRRLVLRSSKERRGNLSKQDKANICRGFEDAAVDVLVHKTIKAAQNYKTKTIMMGGGVSANKTLRNELKKQSKKLVNKPNFIYPDFEFCGDNAAMIAAVAYFKAKKKDFIEIDKIEANPVWRIGTKIGDRN